MTSRTYARCRSCGAHRDDGAVLSKRGYCGKCGPERFRQACDDLHFKRGEEWLKWRRAMAACVGGALLADLPEKE